MLHKPTFMVLGAGKAGTTSLYYYMAQHPEVFWSYPKEPLFFQTEYHRGLEYYWKTYYKGYSGQRHAGEAAHQNLRLPYVTARIAESLPHARFFVICRDPVDRAFSAWWHNVTRKREDRSFEEAIRDNLDRLRTGPRFEDEREAAMYADAAAGGPGRGRIPYASYVDSGYYARHIERFADAVGPERITVLFFEDLVRDTSATMNTVFEVLDLEPIELRDTSAQNTPVSPFMAAVLGAAAGLPGLRSVPLTWRARVKRFLGSLSPSSKPGMSPDTRAMLIEHFRPHNDDLAALTDRDLDHWNGPERRIAA